MRYGGSVEETGGSLDEVGLSRDSEEGGCVLLLIAVTNVLSDREEVRVAEAVLVSGVGSVGDGVLLGRDVRGVGCLTSRLSHSLGGGVVSAVDVAAKAGVLEGVFLLGGVDVDLR